MRKAPIMLGLMAVVAACTASPPDSADTCDPTVGDYDSTLVETYLPQGADSSVTWEYRSHYEDYHAVAVIDGVEVEEILKDGVLYSRRGGGAWSIESDFEEEPVAVDNWGCEPEPAPGQPDRFQKAGKTYTLEGTETLDGQQVKRYQSVPRDDHITPDKPANILSTTIDETLWVNQTGHVVRALLVVRAYQGSTEFQRIERDIEVTGYGEANVITAPAQTETPPT